MKITVSIKITKDAQRDAINNFKKLITETLSEPNPIIREFSIVERKRCNHIWTDQASSDNSGSLPYCTRCMAVKYKNNGK
jgi:hypothetical protein